MLNYGDWLVWYLQLRELNFVQLYSQRSVEKYQWSVEKYQRSVEKYQRSVEKGKRSLIYLWTGDMESGIMAGNVCLK